MLRKVFASLLVLLVLSTPSVSSAWPDEQQARIPWSGTKEALLEKTGAGNTHLFIFQEAVKLLSTSTNERYRDAALGIKAHLADLFGPAKDAMGRRIPGDSAIMLGNFRADNDPGNSSDMLLLTEINEVYNHYNEDGVFRNHFYNPDPNGNGIDDDPKKGGVATPYVSGRTVANALDMVQLWYGQAMRSFQAAEALRTDVCSRDPDALIYPWAEPGVNGKPLSGERETAPPDVPEWMGMRFHWDTCARRADSAAPKLNYDRADGVELDRVAKLQRYQWTADQYESHAWELLGVTLHFLTDMGQPYHSNSFGEMDEPEDLHGFAERYANYAQDCFSFFDDVAAACPESRVKPAVGQPAVAYYRLWGPKEYGEALVGQTHGLFNYLTNSQIDALWATAQKERKTPGEAFDELIARLHAPTAAAMQETIRYTAGFMVKAFYDGPGADEGPASAQIIVQPVRMASPAPDRLTLAWATTEPSDSVVVVHPKDSNEPAWTVTGNSGTLLHEVNIPGLRQGETYDLEIKSADGYQVASLLQRITFRVGPGTLGSLPAIVAGDRTSAAIDLEGNLWLWGADAAIDLDRMTSSHSSVPIEVGHVHGITAVALSSWGVMYVKEDGTVWGWNAMEQFKFGDIEHTWQELQPEQVEGLSDIVALAAGSFHFLALSRGGTVWAWGWNDALQLGTNDDSTPHDRQVRGLPRIIQIAAGDFSSLALAEDGTVWAWGGCPTFDGTIEECAVPTRITGISDVMQIAERSGVSVALKKDGTVWAWDSGWYRFADLDWEPRNTQPVQVKGLTNIRTVAAHDTNVLAVDSAGQVWQWTPPFPVGGPGAGKSAPAEKLALPRALAISAGGSYALALLADGTIQSWGVNGSGQLGDGTTVDRSSPATVQLKLQLPTALGATLPPLPEEGAVVKFVVDDPWYWVDGVPHLMDATPVNTGEHVLIPLRFLAVALGVRDKDIVWDEASRTVTLTRGGRTLLLRQGSRTARLDGRERTLDAAPLNYGGRLMLPARLVAEAFGYQVSWVPLEHAVVFKRN